MIRSLSSLRLTASCMALCAFTLWPHLSAAQNYVDRNAFTGPNVIIDFATLDQARAQTSSPIGSAPVYQEALPFPSQQDAVAQPLVMPRLTPPALQEARPMISATPAPASPHTMAVGTSYTSEADQAYIPPNVQAPHPVASAVQPETKAAFNAESGNIRTRAMLANARPSKEQHGRVNLASINSAPPLPTRATAPIQNQQDTKRSTAPAIAAPTPAKNTIVPMPPQAELDTLDEELPPITTASVARDTGNIPSTPLALPDDAPSSSQANSNFTLNFGKDSGDLDKAAKTELDKIIAALRDDSTLRAQVRAYASNSADNSGQARRLSLTRALAARTYVLDHNIPATRLDIRALGNNKTDSGQTADKVDVTLIK
jgi:outer membrane protein OmpA-like peptidoglycan-associated protein